MFYGQNLQDKFLFEKYFTQKREGLVIEAGAFDGVSESSSKFFEDTMGWSCINVEAYPWAYNRLCVNRPNCENLGVGLSNTRKEFEFMQYNHPSRGPNFGNGSFSHVSWHEEELKQSGCNLEKFLVKCERYDSLIDKVVEEKYFSREVDLFVLDVEGYEIQVIEGMSNSKFLPKVMCVEFPMVGLSALDNALSNLGFRFDTIYANNAMYVRVA